MSVQVRASKIAAYISFNNGRTWVRVEESGSHFHQFRLPPSEARRLVPETDVCACALADTVKEDGL